MLQDSRQLLLSTSFPFCYSQSSGNFALYNLCGWKWSSKIQEPTIITCNIRLIHRDSAPRTTVRFLLGNQLSWLSFWSFYSVPTKKFQDSAFKQTMITGTFHALAHSPLMIIPFLDAIILEHEWMQLNEQSHVNLLMGTKFPRIDERIFTYLINISWNFEHINIVDLVTSNLM
jgi:hypothetical protein